MIQIKKNPEFALGNFSKIFFQIGLVLSLLIIHLLIEYKSYEKNYSNLGVLTVIEEMKEDIPIIEIKKVTPPPKNIPKVMEAIKVVEDELKIEETIIESTETDEGEAIVVNMEDVVEVEETEEVIEDVPFMLISDVPVFPGCKGNNEELKKCFTQKVTQHFSKKFDVELSKELGLSPGKKKLFVIFRIAKNGKIDNVRARGPHPVLEREVTQIINSLPQMIPGKQRGTPVGVSYSIPITFEVRE